MSKTETAKKKETIVAGGLTQKRINSLKTKYGPITLITVKGDENNEDLHFWFKKPTRKELSASEAVAKKNELDGVEVFIKNCMIEGPKEALTELEVFLPLAEQVQNLVQERETEIKNF